MDWLGPASGTHCIVDARARDVRPGMTDARTEIVVPVISTEGVGRAGELSAGVQSQTSTSGETVKVDGCEAVSPSTIVETECTVTGLRSVADAAEVEDVDGPAELVRTAATIVIA